MRTSLAPRNIGHVEPLISRMPDPHGCPPQGSSRPPGLLRDGDLLAGRYTMQTEC